MKIIKSFTVFFILLIATQAGGLVTEVTCSKKSRGLVQYEDVWDDFNKLKVGKYTFGGNTEYYRSFFEFTLPSLSADQKMISAVLTVKTVGTASGSCTVSRFPTEYDIISPDAATLGYYDEHYTLSLDNIPYDEETNINVLAHINLANSSWSISMRAAASSYNWEYAYATLTIKIEDKAEIEVSNSFGSGSIYADGSKSSGATVKKFVGETLSLNAIEQGDFVWNDYQPVNPSRWSRVNSSDDKTLSTSQSYPHSVVAVDHQAIIEAFMPGAYDLNVNANITGSKISVAGMTHSTPAPAYHSVQGNTVNISAVPSQVINGIGLDFTGWSDGDPNYSRELDLSADKNVTCNYVEAEPVWQGRNLSSTSRIGHPVTITWNEHPNSNVTYKIYRKVGSSNEQFVANVGRGIGTYTDNEIIRTGNTSDELIKYDVRAYYTVNGKTSEPYFEAALWGAFLPKFDEGENAELITKYSIENYPNPFNPSTVIRYQLPEAGLVSIKVYDMQGQEIADLVNEVKTSGIYAVQFNASNLSSGTYFYVIKTANYLETKKMLLVK